jgi:hypothetical protein
LLKINQFSMATQLPWFALLPASGMMRLSPPERWKEAETMAADLKEIIEQLKLQRDIVKDGGYGRSVRTPWKEERIFRDSITCLNVSEQVKKHPCNECLLWEWVPEDHKDEDIPCQFIPLNEQGNSIAELEEAGKREEAEQALLVWLDSTIQRLEEKLIKQESAHA